MHNNDNNDNNNKDNANENDNNVVESINVHCGLTDKDDS